MYGVGWKWVDGKYKLWLGGRVGVFMHYRGAVVLYRDFFFFICKGRVHKRTWCLYNGLDFRGAQLYGKGVHELKGHRWFRTRVIVLKRFVVLCKEYAYNVLVLQKVLQWCVVLYNSVWFYVSHLYTHRFACT